MMRALTRPVGRSITRAAAVALGVSMLLTTSGASAASPPIPTHHGARGLSRHGDGGHGPLVLVSNRDDGDATAIDGATRAVIGGGVSLGGTPRDVIFSPNGKTAYAASSNEPTGESGWITPIDIATLTPATAITVGANPVDMAITPDGSTLYT